MVWFLPLRLRDALQRRVPNSLPALLRLLRHHRPHEHRVSVGSTTRHTSSHSSHTLSSMTHSYRHRRAHDATRCWLLPNTRLCRRCLGASARHHLHRKLSQKLTNGDAVALLLYSVPRLRSSTWCTSCVRCFCCCPSVCSFLCSSESKCCCCCYNALNQARSQRRAINGGPKAIGSLDHHWR